MPRLHDDPTGSRRRPRFIVWLACVVAALAAVALLLGPVEGLERTRTERDERHSLPSVRLDPSLPSKARLQAKFGTPRHVRGRVVDPHGNGIAGAGVCASQVAARESDFTRNDDPCTATDVGGGFVLELRHDGAVRVGALAPGWVPMRLAPVVASPHNNSEIEIVMVRGGRRIRGTVRDRLGGVIEGVAVRASGEIPYPAAVTDAQGRYTMWVDEDVSFLWTSHEGYAPGRRLLSGLGWDATVDFELAPEAIIRGRVVAESDGRPVAGVRVYWFPPGDIQHETSLGPFAVSDDAGTFEFRGILPGYGYRPTVIDAQWYGTTRSEVVALLGEEQEVVVPVVPACALEGRIVRDDGSPCPKGRAEAWSKGAGVMLGVSDATGRVQLLGLSAGVYRIEVFCDGYRPETYEAHVSGEHAAVPRLWRVGHRYPGSVRGRVVTREGASRPGARVTVWQPGGGRLQRTTADEEGRFELTGLHLGMLTIEARLPGGTANAVRNAELREGKENLEVELTLPATGRVEVSVLDRTGAPARDAFPIVLHDAFDDSPSWRKVFRTDDSGSVQIDGVPEGMVVVTLMPAGSPLSTTLDEEPLLSERVRVTPDRPARVQFRVEGAFGEIRGTFVRSDGTPVVGARVTAHRERPASAFGGRSIHPTLATAWTDADGAFVLEGLPADVTVILRGRVAGRVVTEERALAGDRVRLVVQPSDDSE